MLTIDLYYFTLVSYLNSSSILDQQFIKLYVYASLYNIHRI